MDDLLISAAAEADYSEALVWYAERSKRAAAGLEADFTAALAAISDHPNTYPMLDRLHRFYLLKRYPYQIIYRPAVDHRWLIVPVAHTSREPGFWQNR